MKEIIYLSRFSKGNIHACQCNRENERAIHTKFDDYGAVWENYLS